MIEVLSRKAPPQSSIDQYDNYDCHDNPPPPSPVFKLAVSIDVPSMMAQLFEVLSRKTPKNQV